MAGRPKRRAELRETTRRTNRERLEAARVENALMHGREFAGHSPPMPELPTLEDVADAAHVDLNDIAQLSDLWPLAHAALEEILTDAGASAAAKVQAARIVQAAQAAADASKAASMPTRMVFETAAYVGD